MRQIVAPIPKPMLWAARKHYSKRRKEVWEALHPEPSADYSEEEMGGTSCPTHPETDALGRKKSPQQAQSFAAETAAITGQSKRDINRNVARAEAIGDDLLRLTGTSLDKGAPTVFVPFARCAENLADVGRGVRKHHTPTSERVAVGKPSLPRVRRLFAPLQKFCRAGTAGVMIHFPDHGANLLHPPRCPSNGCMPDDTDNVSELMAGQLYRTNWFTDSLMDKPHPGQSRAPAGAALLARWCIAIADGRKPHHGQIKAAHVPSCTIMGTAAPARTVWAGGQRMKGTPYG